MSLVSHSGGQAEALHGVYTARGREEIDFIHGRGRQSTAEVKDNIHRKKE